MTDTEIPPKIEEKKKLDTPANTLLACGLTAGALGAGAAIVSGIVCPLCVVATPALLGGGVVMKILEKRKESKLK